MQLTGHSDQVFTLRFNPAGDVLASGSHDKQIFLWRTYGECENFLVLKGHKNAVLEAHWAPDGERLVSCSADKTARVWDSATGQEVKRMQHKDIVNSCCPLRRGPPLVVTGSDDCASRLWDLRARRPVRTLPERFQVLAVALSEGGEQVYTAGIENVVRVWDLRRDEPSMTLAGHSDSVTGMRVSPDGTHLLTNSMDNTLRAWDMRPYAPADRCTRVFTGHTHGFERHLLRCDWSADGARVAAGSADRMVYIWDAATGAAQYALPGHKGSVNEVVFHPAEPIVASASSDKTIYLGELAE
jgi:Prp8 binding protein